MIEKSPIKAIRKHCLSCEEGIIGVKNCVIPDCFLYPFRFGKNPFRKVKKGGKMNENAKKGLEKWRKSKNAQKSLQNERKE